jgi:starch synthase (maltosyl-transferring)
VASTRVTRSWWQQLAFVGDRYAPQCHGAPQSAVFPSAHRWVDYTRGTRFARSLSIEYWDVAEVRLAQGEAMYGIDGRTRVIIEHVTPELDGGRYPIKRVPGESVSVEADIYTDGHDAVSAVIRHCDAGNDEWRETPMEFLVNDRWTGEFTVRHIGTAHYTILAWVDHFKGWQRDFAKRLAAEADPENTIPQEIPLQREIGARLIDDAIANTAADEVGMLKSFASRLRDENEDPRVGLDPLLTELMFHCAPRRYATRYHHDLGISVDRVRARFSTWYELFPRSMSPVEGQHGTFKDVEEFLPRLAEMGFDVVYLPPIHPIGRVHRKGPNNAPPPVDNPTLYYDEGHPGSPWAIGSEEGGHKSIHPELGTLEDFHQMVQTARELGIDIALDLAYQCAPDHPYVKEHPEWFRLRPDGSIQYAENPPKKYQDIYPFDFETENWEALWDELESIIRYWIDQGVRVFRVDNPHTKSFRFWEWTINRLKQEYPDLIFLSEAFTRPKVMHHLAKIGFNQSYTYFAWRNTGWELTEYLTELTRTEQRQFFRPNFWPNTPDILTEFLQLGGRPAFMQRLVLAATMTANYGIYGPAFELCENAPIHHGSEEYLDSEKYEIRQRDLDQPNSLRDFIARVNQIRHENPALQSNESITFHYAENEQVLAYSKYTPDMRDIVLTVVSLDPQHVQASWIEFPVDMFGIDEHQAYLVEDLLNEHSYLWHGSRNYVLLNPQTTPAHIFRVRRRMRSEQDFDYYD